MYLPCKNGSVTNRFRVLHNSIFRICHSERLRRVLDSSALPQDDDRKLEGNLRETLIMHNPRSGVCGK